MSHALVKEIHAWAADGRSEVVHLPGYDRERAKELLHAAFSAPLPIPASVPMVKFTFVVGGGKLCRQQYPDDLQKNVVAELRELGYVEDKSASLVREAAGTYKTQHDTGQNLKYVHVFPRVDPQAPPEEEDNGGVGDGKCKGKVSAAAAMAQLEDADVAAFKGLIAERCRGWSQKKRVLDALKARTATLDACTKKLVEGHALTAEEQGVYDRLDADMLRDKCKYLQDVMHAHLEAGELTQGEVAQLRGKLDEKAAALGDPNEKKNAKLMAFIEEQRGLLAKCAAGYAGPPFRQASALSAAYIKLAPMLEQGGPGHFLTVKQIADRTKLEESIAAMEADEQAGAWLEEPEEFQARLKALKKKSKPAPAKSAGGGGGPKSYVTTGEQGWQTSKRLKDNAIAIEVLQNTAGLTAQAVKDIAAKPAPAGLAGDAPPITTWADMLKQHTTSTTSAVAAQLQRQTLDLREEAELAKRSLNVIVKNLKMEEGENSEKLARAFEREILDRMGLTGEIELAAHRLPRARGKAGPPPLLLTPADKISFLRRRKRLEKTLFTLDDDLTLAQQQRRRELWPTYLQLRQTKAGQPVYWKGAAIYVGHKPWQATPAAPATPGAPA
eukprot:jgi/Mesvir1/3704/Mv14990-RA.1